MISFPNAKINLGLNILKKRNDGYHDLSSCFYPIPFHDVLEIIDSKKFSFQSTGIKIPWEEKENLVLKAYKSLKKDFDLPEVAIHLHKNIPMGAGLGGGSADAAFALRSLSEHFELYLDESILADIAGTIGSDCPFFIYNRPLHVKGRGELMDDINLDLKDYYMVLIKPGITISTREAYQKITPRYPDRDVQDIIENIPINMWKEYLKNDFEEGIFSIYPVLASIKQQLYAKGALYASMTGSGSTIFGIFQNSKPADLNFPGEMILWEGIL